MQGTWGMFTRIPANLLENSGENTGTGNGMRGMRETRGIFTRIPGNLLEDSRECYYFNIPGNVPEDFGEC